MGNHDEFLFDAERLRAFQRSSAGHPGPRGVRTISARAGEIDVTLHRVALDGRALERTVTGRAR